VLLSSRSEKQHGAVSEYTVKFLEKKFLEKWSTTEAEKNEAFSETAEHHVD
jgi:hypothetical protein